MYVRVHKATLGDSVYTHGMFASVFEVCCAHFYVPVTWQSVFVLHDHDAGVK